MPETQQQFEIVQTDFISQNERCAGTLYLPKAVGKIASNPPVIILGHGFAALREMRLLG